MSNSENFTKSSTSLDKKSNIRENFSKLDHRNIEMNEFLDFLKISCHVNDLISNTKAKGGNSTIATKQQNVGTAVDFEIDFDKLAANEMLKELYGPKISEEDRRIWDGSGDQPSAICISNGCNKSGSAIKKPSSEFIKVINNEIHPKLDKKLQNVIDEGVLDSILPYVCPPVAVIAPIPYKNTNHKTSKNNNHELNSIGDAIPVTGRISSGEKGSIIVRDSSIESPSTGKLKSAKQKRRKSSVVSCNNNKSNTSITTPMKKGDNDVVIHVCDEAKNLTKDFLCPQQLLVSKMGYFADVTAGQKLQDMDISVHCDIQIFEWLMKWIKKNSDQVDPAVDDSPQIDATNVIPILVSANFLQMEPLLIDCLTFCHSHLSDIVRLSTNLSCLNDSIVTRLAAMFTNLELEMVKDKKERFTPRLWIKLIQSIFEPEPQVLRGHFFTLAGLFRCSKCGKCLTHTIKSHVNCLPPTNVRLNRWGQLISQHTRDLTWNVSTYITSLFKELKSWRKVYWKLWGHCHFLYCCICEMHFPVYQMTWCRFHPETAHYFGTVNEGRMAGPAGRYPCCGQQAFRYEPMAGSNGCQFREHNVLIETDRDRSIFALVQIAAENDALFENPPENYQELPRAIAMSLLLTRTRQGLLPTLYPADFRPKQLHRIRQGLSCNADSSSDSDLDNNQHRHKRNSNKIKRPITVHNVTSSDGCESDDSYREVSGLKNSVRRHTETMGRFWSGEVSARSNQDNQRDFEEKVMKQVISIVNRKTGAAVDTSQNATATPGSYMRLEAEWKEQLKMRNAAASSVKQKSK